MTVKTRNRLSLGLFVIAISIFAFNAFILVLRLLRGELDIASFPNPHTGKNFLTVYNPYVALASIYIQILYVIVASYLLFRIFEKTQASDIVYFHLFLVSCLIDSFRLWIPLFNAFNSYSNLLVFCGNSVLFGRLLIPFSLLFTVYMGDIEKRQDIEKNIFILFCTAFFFAHYIPLNTAITNPNFSIDYSFSKIIKITTIIVIASCTIHLFIQNYQNRRSQKTAFGYLLIYIGISFLFNAVSIVLIVVAVPTLTTGTILYLRGLHNQYLWYD